MLRKQLLRDLPSLRILVDSPHSIPKIRASASIVLSLFLLLTFLVHASPRVSADQPAVTGRRVLATADFDLIGLAVTAEPGHQDIPKHTATAILTRLGLPGTTLPPDAQLSLNPNYRVRAELTGPSLSTPLMLEAAIGTPLSIPPLSRAGDHLVQNLRLVDAGLPGAPVVVDVVPDSCTITVLDQLLVSEVQVHELTYDEILRSGLNINRDSYSYYGFTLALGTMSLGQKITIPVALPRLGVDPIPLVGTPDAPVGTGVPLPDVLPVLLKPAASEGSEIPDFELEKIRIPGLVVFPGRVGLLHQFFEAVVIVTNGAPQGTPLVVSSLRARIRLPQRPNPLDNPLQVADLQVGGRVEELALHGLGPDEAYGTGDDTIRFTPGDSGQASFLIEGLREGLHSVYFELNGTIEGLPVGPVAIEGEVSGAVLVRDGRFAISFTHPSVVRAGQEYQLSMTLFNSGNRDLLGVYSELLPASISGADLIVDPQNPTPRRDFPTTIKPGDSGTIIWKLRARVTGAVTASYTKVEGAAVALNLVTGVGDRNVPLSPESLILPDPVKYLPSSVVDASRNLLGQAWSIATAPSGTLPAGVLPVSKQTVFDRAVELGVAGLRVRFGEALHVSLLTLLRDWLGESDPAPDEGFADTMGSTSTGYAWFDTLGVQFSDSLGSGLAVDSLHRALCENEMARSRFLSAFVTHPAGSPVAGVRFVGPDGRAVGMTGPSDRFGALETGAMLRLDSTVVGQTHSRGRLLLVSTPDPGRWLLELYAWQSGSVDVSLVLPVDDDSYRSLKFSNVPLVAGGIYRISFDPYFSSSARVEQCPLGACSLWGPQPLVQYVDEKQPAVLGAVQLAPGVLESGDRYGRLVGVLFSKPMSVINGDKAASYRIGGGAPVGSVSGVSGSRIEVTEANLGLGNRFALLGLSAPIGPFFNRTLSVSSLTDTRGLALNPSCVDRPVETTVSPGGVPPAGFLTGRVLNGDGTPVANAPVTISVMPCELWRAPLLLSRTQTDADGNYVFDYVINGDCSPVIVSALHPVTGSEKELSTPVSYHGQHLVMDLVFLARGAVQGTVTLGGSPVNGAYVRVVPDSDLSGGQLVRSDSQGRYLAFDIPVGRVSVFAAGSATFSNATGFSGGWIDGPGQTARVDVSLQSVSGSVSGHVQGAAGRAIANMLVVASAMLPGLADPVYVGFCYSGPTGEFNLQKLPVTSITVQAVEEATNLRVSQVVQLTTQAPAVSGVILALPGFGAISGRVTDQAGRYIGGAGVTCGSTTVLADVFGYFSFPMVPAGSRTVRAVHPETGLSAYVTVIVNAAQTTGNVNLVISAAATVRGTVLIMQAGAGSVPLVGAKISHDGRTVVTTDGQGGYTLRNVTPGQNLVVRFLDPTGRLAINQSVRLNPGETLIRNVTFHPAGIVGRVFQPDGQTGAIARIELWVPRPTLKPGESYGLLELSDPITTVTSGDGSYLIANVNPADFRITAYNDFFPTRVSRLGHLSGDSQINCNLTLVDTLAGSIHGRVYRPDGTTPAGPGIWVTLGGGTLADARIQTDDAGEYRFPDVFGSGTYSVTADDPKTGASNRIWISVEKNKDVVADIRLLGYGSIQVAVVDGAGAPVESGIVEVSGVDFPNTSDLGELFAGSGGHALFEQLPEGHYAITASRLGLSGRVSAVVPNGGIVAVTVKLQPAGTVLGRVLMPDGSTPAGLADVRLIVAGKTVGYCTSADDGTGSFNFPNVPVGDFKLEAFDNRSTRMGRTAGRVSQQGQEVTADITLLPVGIVRGQVTANNAAVDHALVTIMAGESGFSFTYLKATTDLTGSYRFSGIPVGKFRLSATHPSAALTGSAEGVLDGISEPIPDKIVNITLESSATLSGFVYDHGGTPVAGAQITVRIGSRTFQTASRENGSYRVDYVPLGEATVRAEAPAGFDRGETGPVSIPQPGATVTADVTFNGTGIVKGDALDSDGTTRLTSGTVTFTNVVWSPAVVVSAPVVDGRYLLEGVPAGSFSLKLAVSGRAGVGSAASSLAAGQTLTLNLKLEPAGTITGRVLKTDGVTPAVGVDITTSVTKADSTKLTLVAHTDSTGHFRHEEVPLGAITISVSDPDSDAIGLATGLSLAANGQVLDVPIVLDDQPIAVVSVSPANGALKVPRSTTVVVKFSEPAKTSTVSTSSFRLLKGGLQQPATVTLSPDGLMATLTPASLLSDEATYTVSVSTQVTDRVGHRLASEFRSTFSTPDDTPPVVISVTPADGTAQVPLDAVLEVSFSEELDQNQSFTAGIIRLFPEGQPQALVPLDATLQPGGKILVARPSSPLTDSTQYRLEVTGQRDLSGNIQGALYSAIFETVDLTAPVIDSISIEGQTVPIGNPLIEVQYHDNGSGIDRFTASVVFLLDDKDVRSGAVINQTYSSYQVPSSTPLSKGQHTVKFQINDKAGNTCELRTATFTVDDVPPQIVSFTIAQSPAFDGMTVTVPRPRFRVDYSDNGFIDSSATCLMIGPVGGAMQRVPATVLPDWLSYEPSSDLAPGTYVVEVLVVDRLGNSTSSGQVRFIQQAALPVVTDFAPPTGSQHGGSIVVLRGTCLLGQTGAAPTVRIGPSPAFVVSAQAGPIDTVMVVTPPAAPGPATIELTNERGTTTVEGFVYEPDSRTPLAVEKDTILLWHLDEPFDGELEMADSGPFANNGEADSESLGQPARFGFGRSGTVRMGPDSRPIGLGAGSFTVEFMVRTASVPRTYLLVGTQPGTAPSFGVSLLPSGRLRGWLQDQKGLIWSTETEMPPLSVVDDVWHYVAMVVDRQAGMLRLNVEGADRAFSGQPTGFGEAGGLQGLVVGEYEKNDSTAGPLGFPGVVDEVRISASAHSTSRIQEILLGQDGPLPLEVTHVQPDQLVRGMANEIVLHGYNLADVLSELLDVSGTQLPVEIRFRSATEARLLVQVPVDGGGGETQLRVTGFRGHETLSLAVLDPERSAPQVEEDTVLLWHFDTSPDTVTGDDGPFVLSPTAGWLTNGFSGDGRSGFVRAKHAGILDFRGLGFTVEAWVKTDINDLIEIYNDWYSDSWKFGVTEEGGLYASVWDTDGTEWRAEMSPLLVDVAGEQLQVNVDDGCWHHIALVVDRAAGQLRIYRDGREGASSPVPEGFGQVLPVPDSYFEADMGWNGVIDELRVSGTTHSAEKIWEDFSGSHHFAVTAIWPVPARLTPIQRSIVNQLVIKGYDLRGFEARVTRNGSELPAQISSSLTDDRRAVLQIQVDRETGLGAAELRVSKTGWPDASIPVEIVDSQPSALTRETLELWRFDESDQGRIEVRDSGPLAYGATTDSASQAVPGRFGNGRNKANLSFWDDNILDSSAQSFTVDCWVKAGATEVPTSYDLRANSGFAFTILPSGALRLRISDQAGVIWQADAVSSSPDRLSRTLVNDGYWHWLSAVVDLEHRQLRIYVDGVLKAVADEPPGFGKFSDTSLDAVAKRTGSASNTPMQFPGAIDELRVCLGAASPERIADEFAGRIGARLNQMSRDTIDLSRTAADPTVTTLILDGFHLDGLEARLTREGQAVPGVGVQAESSALKANLAFTVAPGVTAGPADLELRVGDQELVERVRVVENSPFSIESDSVLLWHLDDGGSLPRILDSAPFAIHGNADAGSVATQGRFDLAQTTAILTSDPQYGALEFGTSSFTAEFWMKMPPYPSPRTVTQYYTPLEISKDLYNPAFRITVKPSQVAVSLTDTTGKTWIANAPSYLSVAGRAFVKPMLDNQWHLFAVAVDRQTAALRIYIDGVERAFAPMPVGFGSLVTGTDVRFRSSPSGARFPGALDEIRLSASAHTPSQITAAFNGHDTPSISRVFPAVVPRGSDSFPLTLHGYGLAGAIVQSLSSDLQVVSATALAGRIDLQVSVSPAAVPGNARLALTDPFGQTCFADLGVTAPQPFTNSSPTDGDTLVLWHLDEQGNGAVPIAGSGDQIPNVIGGTASQYSLAKSGILSGARARINAVAGAGFGSFEPGSSSFSVDGWVKTRPVGRAYDLVGRSAANGSSPEFAITLFPSGKLRARLYDTGNRIWTAEMLATAFDGTSGTWKSCVVDDDQWHLVTAVVDRSAARLRLYVDGDLRASTAAPAGFVALKNANQRFRAGLCNSVEVTVFPDENEFPGMLDEIRLGKGVRTLEEIRASFGFPVVQPISQIVSAQARGAQEGPESGQAKSGRPDTHPAPETIETVDTILLWHLDEPGDGVIRIEGEADTGPNRIGGSSGPDSHSVPGLLQGGRQFAAITGDPDGGALDFGRSSFTIDFWLKTDPVGRTYTLVGRSGPPGQVNDFSVSISPAGSLAAWLADSKGDLWSIRTAHAVDTGEWTRVSVVVDRGTGWMSLWIDGEEVATEVCPEGFEALRNSGEPLRAGWVDPWGPSTFGGPNAFPGVLDEIRFSSEALPASRIWTEFSGIQ